MNVLNGLRMAWIKLNESKNNVNSNGDIVYSEDNELIEKKLDEMLMLLSKRDYSGKPILNGFVYDISNRQTMIYPEGKKKKHWKYKLIINKEDGSHYFELSINNYKVMKIETKTTLKGELLSFNAMYLANLSDYIGNTSNKGTTFINIDCPKDGVITFDNRIYSLDLLNNNYPNEVLDDSILAEYQAYLGNGRALK